MSNAQVVGSYNINSEYRIEVVSEPNDYITVQRVHHESAKPSHIRSFNVNWNEDALAVARWFAERMASIEAQRMACCYRHGLVKAFLYTDGVMHFAENAGGGAYWFLDIIATEVLPLLKKEPFIHIVLAAKDRKATIKADDGNGVVLWDREIEFTDCPTGEWRFYLTDNVLMVPSEY